MTGWLAIVVAVLLLAVGLALAGAALSAFLRYRAMAGWPAIQGNVALTGLDSERRVHRHAARLVFMPTVAYRYRVGAEDHIGSRLSNVPLLFEHEAEATGFLSRFPDGAPITVRYNPAAPQDAVIDPRIPNLVPLLAPALLALIAAVLIWWY